MFLDINPWVELCIWVAYVMGGFICVANFSLPVRYYLDRWRKRPHGPHVSAVPIIGSLTVYLTLKALGDLPAAYVIGIVLIAIDVGGIHWVVISIFIHLFRYLIRLVSRHVRKRP